jgi:hypothetical protein
MLWDPEFKTCPKTGKVQEAGPRRGWYRWIWPVAGFLATLWFLIRVIPKPSRALYPCQRAAFPIASSFVAYLIGLATTTAILGKARAHIKQARYVVAAVCIFVAVMAAWVTMGIDGRSASAVTYAPSDPVNTPIGVARGVYPGRVVWVHDPAATTWSTTLDNQIPVTDPWWGDAHTNQAVVDEMYSKGVRWLTDSTTDEQAWDKLFRYFNQRHGRGDVGYTPGEKIAIKPNHVAQRDLVYADTLLAADMTPQMMVALLKQLVNKAGVPQDCITICDSSRYISNKEFNPCYALFPDVHYLSSNFYLWYSGYAGDDDPRRPPVEVSTTAFVHYSGIGATGQPIPPTPLPKPFADASYVVNLAITKGHSGAAVTLGGKNWYGCFCAPPGEGDADWSDPADSAHVYLPNLTAGMGHYRLMVDLMGNQNLGEKTFLFVQDFLWGFQHHGGSSRPVKFSYAPFNNDYPSSLLMSQDMVAIDSVGHDFLTGQFANAMGGNSGITWSGVDDYLHEAAEADNPSSGTFYAPNGDGVRLASLGVHEHWNNKTSKQYTRNLHTGSGIELISSDPLACTSPPAGDFSGDCKVNMVDLAWTVDMQDIYVLAQEWLACGVADGVGCWQ